MQRIYTEILEPIDWPEGLGSYVVHDGTTFHQIQVVSITSEGGLLAAPTREIYVAISGDLILLEDYAEDHSLTWYEADSYSVADLIEIV